MMMQCIGRGHVFLMESEDFNTELYDCKRLHEPFLRSTEFTISACHLPLLHQVYKTNNLQYVTLVKTLF